MLKNRSDQACCPAVERVINEIVKNDFRYALTEMRSVHRENLVVPVTLIFTDGSQQYAFSRNVSPVGICLVGKEPLEESRIVDLEIYRLDEEPCRIAADLRWCKPFGKEYYMSGWKFLRLRRG